MAESSAENALGAYMVAMAYHENVELFQVENPGIANVEEVEPDVYRILFNREERDELVMAECTYHELTDEWTVDFSPRGPEDEGDFLTVAWDEAAQQYTVMGGEEEPAG